MGSSDEGGSSLAGRTQSRPVADIGDARLKRPVMRVRARAFLAAIAYADYDADLYSR